MIQLNERNTYSMCKYQFICLIVIDFHRSVGKQKGKIAQHDQKNIIEFSHKKIPIFFYLHLLRLTVFHT